MVLVPFLLSVSVFTHLAVIDLSLPAQSNDQVQKLDPNKPLKLEVIDSRQPHRGERQASAERSPARRSRTWRRAPTSRASRPLLQALKMKYPQHDDASVLVESEIPYDRVVQVMDAVRGGHQVQGARIVTTDYFPNISVGDAPVIRQ